MRRKALGKGLDALFSTEADGSEDVPAAETGKQRIISVSVNDIIPNRNQPRERFSDEGMQELRQSIAENGIIEPPVVRRKEDFYELIAGERRFRAAKDLGFDTIDVIVMDVVSEEKAMVLSLIENIQREDLNAIEEAKAYKCIMDTMQATQEDLAGIVGKSRSSVANMLRLLSLSGKVASMVAEGVIAPGSARALIPVEDDRLQLELARKIASEGLTARKAEELVKKTLNRKPRKNGGKELDPHLAAVRDGLRRRFGTDVKISGSESRGRITIEYFSKDDLERVLETISGDDPS